MEKEFYADKISNAIPVVIIVVCIIVGLIPLSLEVELAKKIGFACLFGIVYCIVDMFKNSKLSKTPMLTFKEGTFQYFKGAGKTIEIPIDQITSFNRKNRIFDVTQVNGRKIRIIASKFSDKSLNEIEVWVNENILKA